MITYEQLLERLKSDLAVGGMKFPGWLPVVVFGILGVLVLLTIWGCFYTVQTNNFAMVERFGKYIKTSQSGLHFKFPIIDKVWNDWSYEIEEHTVKVETITSDKVTVVIEVPVQFCVLKGAEFEAAYKLEDQYKRIESLVFDEVRSRAPKMSLNELFNSKDDIAKAVKVDMQADLNPFGWDVDRVMIADIEPDAKVKAAMNEVNASLKEGEAALARANNEQQVQVANAEGRLKAARLNKDAEIIDAEAVSQSVQIIGSALHNNHGYLQWQWIHMMKDNKNSVIYVPTEASLPILEAGKRSVQSEG